MFPIEVTLHLASTSTGLNTPLYLSDQETAPVACTLAQFRSELRQL